ncbi:MAG: serine hydrolase [Aerococcus sp.]|nr:serine hydrolase [Aerococcus sp.]
MDKQPGPLARYLQSLFLVMLGCGLFTLGSASAATNQNVDAFSQTIDQNHNFQFQSAMAIDQATGQVLYQHNPDQLEGIASLSKVITLGVIYDEIKQGKLSLEDTVPVSDEVSALSTTEGLSNVPLITSTNQYTVSQLMDAAMIESANAAVVALAEHVGKTEDQFVKNEMTQKIKVAGVTDFKLYSASGLPGNYVNTDNQFFGYAETDENQLSAAGYLKVVRNILNDYPEIMTRSLANKKAFAVDDQTTITMENQNEMVPGMASGRSEITGGKTGTGDLSGYSLLVQLTIAGRKVLVVTLGDPTKASRYSDMWQLLDALESQLQWYTIHQTGEIVGGTNKQVLVANGNQTTTQLYYGSSVGLFLPKDQLNDPQIELGYRDQLQYDTEGQLQVSAPLTKDETVNMEYYHLPFAHSLLSKDGSYELKESMKAKESISEVSFFVKISRLMNDTIANVTQWFQSFFKTMGY